MQLTDNPVAMKLATLKSKYSRDGELIVVSRDNNKAVKAALVSASLREAIENWEKSRPLLEEIYNKLNTSEVPGEFKIDIKNLHSPLPRSFQWIDGSAFLHHVKLVRQARKAPLPENLFTIPLMYQGGSDTFLAPTDAIPQLDFSHGTDFEAEVAVVVDDVEMGISAEEAIDRIILIMSVNDISLRGLIPAELSAGFGFLQSKPSSVFGPFAVTPDELGEYWKEGRVHLPLLVNYNNSFFGKANGKEMHFHFGELISHAAKTRNLIAGTIIGSGTFSNEDRLAGSSCLVEKRMIETIESGQAVTPFMKNGDVIEIKMLKPNGENIFGQILQRVEAIRPYDP